MILPSLPPIVLVVVILNPIVCLDHWNVRLTLVTIIIHHTSLHLAKNFFVKSLVCFLFPLSAVHVFLLLHQGESIYGLFCLRSVYQSRVGGWVFPDVSYNFFYSLLNFFAVIEVEIRNTTNEIHPRCPTFTGDWGQGLHTYIPQLFLFRERVSWSFQIAQRPGITGMWHHTWLPVSFCFWFDLFWFFVTRFP